MTEDAQLIEFITLIEKLKANKFYGELVIKMEAGHIVLIKKTENIKLSK